MFEGPRGGMYQTDVFGFRRAIETILVGTNDSELLAQSKSNGRQNATLESLCPSCDLGGHPNPAISGHLKTGHYG